MTPTEPRISRSLRLSGYREFK